MVAEKFGFRLPRWPRRRCLGFRRN